MTSNLGAVLNNLVLLGVKNGKKSSKSNLGLIMLDTALFILEGVLLKEKARPTYEGDILIDTGANKAFSCERPTFSRTGLQNRSKTQQDIVKDKLALLSHIFRPQNKNPIYSSLTLSIISMLFTANGERTPYKSTS